MTLLISESSGLYTARPSGRKGQRYKATDVPHGDFYCDGSIWRPVIRGVLGKEPPTSGWTTQNFRGGSDILTTGGATRSIEGPTNSASNQVRCETRSLSLLNKTIVACVQTTDIAESSVAQNGAVFIGAYESSTTKVSSFNQQGAGGDHYFSLYHFTAPNTFLNASFYQGRPGRNDSVVWLKLVVTGTNWSFYASEDGFSYVHVVTQSIATHMTGSGPDNLAWGINPYTSYMEGRLLSLDWT